MSRIRNDLMDKVERGEYKYNPNAKEYQPIKKKFYTVVVEGMDIGLRFKNKEDAMERVNSFGVDAHLSYVMEMRK
jgi:hypothetical protein